MSALLLPSECGVADNWPAQWNDVAVDTAALWLRDPASVHIEPAEGAIVQGLFARYLQGNETLLSLAKHLLTLGLPFSTWESTMERCVSRAILTNPMYIGKL
jgi:hypothetical protein